MNEHRARNEKAREHSRNKYLHLSLSHLTSQRLQLWALFTRRTRIITYETHVPTADRRRCERPAGLQAKLSSGVWLGSVILTRG